MHALHTQPSSTALRPQTADALVMVRPARFGFNAQTALSNTFQQQDARSAELLLAAAREEFEGVVRLLLDHQVEVHVLEDPPEPPCPDAVFPNNWFSTSSSGALILYPMAAPNRRLERRPAFIPILQRLAQAQTVVDLSGLEAQEAYMEGTGSLVLDHASQTAYAALSVRTHPRAAAQAVSYLGPGWKLVSFRTRHPSGVPIYHTNVLMAIGEHSAVVAPGLIASPRARLRVLSLLGAHHTLVLLEPHQVEQFAGNMLQVRNRDGQRFWVMSDAAWRALTQEQKAILSQDCPLLFSPIPTIERIGGGSLRCMLAEIFRARACRP